MATVEANVTPLEKELIIYSKGIPELLEVDSILADMMEKEESDPASNRPTRIPLLTQIGGTFQQVDMNGGDMGSTSGPQWNVATLAPIYFTGGYSYTALAKYATTGAGRAVESVAEEVMRLSVEQQRAVMDMVMNTGGNGQIGTITSVSTNTFTMTTDGFREELVYLGQNVQVYNSTGVTNRGNSTVTAIDHVNNKITVASAPGGTTGGDLLVIGGLSGTITAQSSLFGIQYFQSDATTGLYMNIDRSVVSNVITPSVNANSSSLVTSFIRLALNRIRMNLGDKFFNTNRNTIVPYMHPAEADAYEALAITISQIFKEPSGNEGVDLMFGNQDNLSMSGLRVRQSIHQDRTRIDFLCMKYWGRIIGTDTGLYNVGGKVLFPVIGASGDSLKSSQFFYIVQGLQMYNRNPLSGSYIKSLTPPTGY